MLHLWDVHKKNGVTFLPMLLHVVFVQNRSFLAVWMGRGKSRGRVVLAWEENCLSGVIKVESSLRTLSYCLNKSKVRYSEFGPNQLYPCNPAFQRCWFSADPTGPNGTASCSALLRLVPLDVLTCKLMKQMKTEIHTIFKGND